MYGLVPRKNTKDIIDNRITPVVSSLIDAQLLSETAVRFEATKPIDIMIAVETGLNRVGFLSDEKSIDAIREISMLPGIRVAALFSHFATSEEEDRKYALKQFAEFKAFGEALRDAGVNPGVKTMSNSGGIALMPEAAFDFVRPGLALYGLYPSPAAAKTDMDLRRVMSIKANIVLLRSVPAGSAVSYGRRFKTERQSNIAVLPLGYADGLPRSAVNALRVLVRGHYVPVVGSICMDQCMIDVTDVAGVREYDEVVVLGEQGGLSVTAEDIAEKAGTIPYEVLCRFGQRLPRIYK
jgi:alanine racemase